MITDDKHPAMQRAAEHLHARISAHAARRGRLDTRLLEDLQALIVQHRRECRLRSLDFPQMVVVPLFQAGGLEVIRRDTTREALQVHVRNMCVKYRGLTSEDIVQGLRYAFPQFRAQQFEVTRPVASNDASRAA